MIQDGKGKKKGGGSGGGSGGKKLVTELGQLADDQKCIYQAFHALTGYSEEQIAKDAMGTKKVKEIDDEAAAVALADLYGYAGPVVATGAEFWQLKASAHVGKSLFLIITRSGKVKTSAAFTARDGAAMRAALETGVGMEGVPWHAIGVTGGSAGWAVHDEQKLWPNGPQTADAVVYWVK